MNLESFANLFAASLRRVEADQESEDEEEIDMSKSQVSCVAVFFFNCQRSWHLDPKTCFFLQNFI